MSTVVSQSQRYLTPLADAAYIAACSPDRMREVLDLARQAEAMKREMAEKDARIAALEAERRMIVSHATMGNTDGDGMSVNAVSVHITRLRNQLLEDTRANSRALIGGDHAGN